MTDNDIIKALECCAGEDACSNECPGNKVGCEIEKYTLALINRQKAEIERLGKAAHDWENCFHRMDSLYHIKCMELKVAKAEAIKEFAERLKTEIADALKSNYRAKTEHIEKHYKCLSCDLLAMIRGKIDALRGIDDYIDNLVKEMVGERE